MTTVINLSGHVYGQLTVLARDANRNGKSAWLCKCSCGTEVVVRGNDLRRGSQKSCGCLRGIPENNGRYKHGHRLSYGSTRTYRIWAAMLHRCRGVNSSGYHNYGGRGIKVTSHWDSFENFLEDMGECPDGLTLERKENNGDYEPDNCVWATRQQQARNRRDTKKLTYGGQTKSVPDWADRLGLHPKTIHRRLARGLPVSKALQKRRVSYV